MPRARARIASGLALLALLGPAACASPTGEPRDPINSDAGLGLRGYDPVAYFALRVATRGDAAHTTHYGGVEYRFASAEHLARFEADPVRYLPQYGGYCAIAMAWDRVADVDPEAWAIVDGRLFLNNSAFAHALWKLGRGRNIEAADAHWKQRGAP